MTKFKTIAVGCIAILAVGCAARHAAPVRTIHDKPIEVKSSTPMIEAATTQQVKAEKSATTANDIASSVGIVEIAVATRQTLQDVRDIAPKLNAAKANSEVADGQASDLQAQVKDWQGRTTTAEADYATLSKNYDELESGQGVWVIRLLGLAGAVFLIGGAAAAVLSPTLKKTAALGALCGFGLIISSQILGTINTYKKEITFGLMAIVGAYAIFALVMYVKDSRRKQREIEAVKREAEAKQREIEAKQREVEANQRAVKEVVEGIENANEKTKDLNLTPEVAAVFKKAQSPETEDIVWKAKKVIEKEKASANPNAKVIVDAVVEKAKVVVEKGEVVVEKMEAIVEKADK